MSQRIVFTDLDGTLLHPITYSYHESVEAVKWLRENGIPIVFCSAKTRAEQKVYHLSQS
jgi:mannosyl-3-phosphoglycerate synthase